MIPMNREASLFRVRHAAATLIKRFAITHPEEIVLEDIAMALGILVLEDNLEGAEARLVRKEKRGIIRVRADIPEIGRKRFAIAHDIGHWESHVNLSQLALCTETDLLEYSGSSPEVEANAFASELLMPTVLFRPCCENAEPNMELVKTLANEFNTTLTATAVRLVEECRENCLVIFSENGRVRWWRGGNRQDNLYIEPHQVIHRDSFAWNCLNNRQISQGMQLVANDVWFQDQYNGEKIEVYEQSIRLGRYPTILTLLWIIENDEDGNEESDCVWWRS